MSTALVVGATGSTGAPIVDALVAAGRQVLAVARHIEADPRPGIEAIAVDASDPAALGRALAGRRVGELYFAARHRTPEDAERARDLPAAGARRLIRALGRVQAGLGWVPGLSAALRRRYALASRIADPEGRTLAIRSSAFSSRCSTVSACAIESATSVPGSRGCSGGPASCCGGSPGPTATTSHS